MDTLGASASGLQIDLVNFEAACGAAWKGSSSATDGGLELRVANPGVDPCPGAQPFESSTATLPLSSAAQGELCRYASYGGLGWQAGALGQCGRDR